MGLPVGLLVGFSDLDSVGLPVGLLVGLTDLDSVGLPVGFSDLDSVGLAVDLLDAGGGGLELFGGGGVELLGGGGPWQAGSAGSLLGVWKNLTSALRRLTRPWRTWPLSSLFHWGSSLAATVLGFSPALRRLMRSDLATLPQPTLKAQLTSAPYWLALRTTLSLVSW